MTKDTYNRALKFLSAYTVVSVFVLGVVILWIPSLANPNLLLLPMYMGLCGVIMHTIIHIIRPQPKK